MMATSSFETSVTTCPATQCHISKQIHWTKFRAGTNHKTLSTRISHID